ncbi:MAG: ComEC/Rec2 family competence protein [Nitrospiria bacterium]
MMVLALPLLFTPIPITTTSTLNIHFIDVGYGDAILLRLPEDGAILIDGGKPESAPRVIAELEKHGIQSLTALIITHFHDDHAGGLLPILKRYLRREADVFLPFTSSEIDTKQARYEIGVLADALQAYVVKTLRRGTVLNPSPSVRIEVFHPDAVLTGDQNEDSLVIKITHGEVSLLLAADAGPDTQQKLVEIYGNQLHSDLIKIPHHANETEVFQPFIETVHPRIAVLTIGPNPYGAPNPEVLEAYKEAGVRLYRSDQHGSIHVTSDGQILNIATERP